MEKEKLWLNEVITTSVIVQDGNTNKCLNYTGPTKLCYKPHKSDSKCNKTSYNWKLEIIKKERENICRDIFGISELMWTGKGHFCLGG